MTFIKQRSREEFWLTDQADKIGDKIHCTASKVDETWMNYP